MRRDSDICPKISNEVSGSLHLSFGMVCDFVKLGHLSPFSGGGTVCYEFLLAHRIFDKITLSYLVERQSVLSCEGDIHFSLTFLEVVCTLHRTQLRSALSLVAWIWAL